MFSLEWMIVRGLVDGRDMALAQKMYDKWIAAQDRIFATLGEPNPMYNDQDYVPGGLHSPKAAPMTAQKPVPAPRPIVYVKRIADIPADAHYAVIVNTTYVTPGYDRGDPNETVNDVSYMAFFDEVALVKWIKDQDEQRYGSKPVYKVVYIRPITIEKQVTVKIV
jgi:hypothetical protein